MLRAIHEFFQQNLQISDQDASPSDIDHRLKLATAALLIETSRADFDVQPEELLAISENLCAFFDLDKDELAEIISLAEQEASDSVSLHQFTSLINQHYSAEQRVNLVEMMWRISFVDGEKNAHEDHLVRKVAGLLYVPHRDFIAAKLRAQRAMR